MNQPTIILEARAQLLKLENIINQLSFDEYTKKINLLSEATIGEHIRHIIELFQQLENGYPSGIINYDNRKREIKLQENIDFAIETIANLIKNLKKENKNLSLSTIYNNHEKSIESNYYRELLFNIEHCVHHQAIIKIGLLQLQKNELSKNFGVAKSTLEYRKQCVQ